VKEIGKNKFEAELLLPAKFGGVVETSRGAKARLAKKIRFRSGKVLTKEVVEELSDKILQISYLYPKGYKRYSGAQRLPGYYLVMNTIRQHLRNC
jgi:hypothetical protein